MSPKTKSTIRIPEDWTPSRAFAVAGFLEDIFQAVWDVHGDAMIPLIIGSLHDAPNGSEHIGLDDEDDIPF